MVKIAVRGRMSQPDGVCGVGFADPLSDRPLLLQYILYTRLYECVAAETPANSPRLLGQVVVSNHPSLQPRSPPDLLSQSQRGKCPLFHVCENQRQGENPEGSIRGKIVTNGRKKCAISGRFFAAIKKKNKKNKKKKSIR